MPGLRSKGALRRNFLLQQQSCQLVWHVEHHIMPAGKPSLPSAPFARLGVKLFERAIKATRQNVSDGREAVAGASDPRRLF